MPNVDAEAAQRHGSSTPTTPRRQLNEHHAPQAPQKARLQPIPSTKTISHPAFSATGPAAHRSGLTPTRRPEVQDDSDYTHATSEDESDNDTAISGVGRRARRTKATSRRKRRARRSSERESRSPRGSDGASQQPSEESEPVDDSLPFEEEIDDGTASEATTAAKVLADQRLADLAAAQALEEKRLEDLATKAQADQQQADRERDEAARNLELQRQAAIAAAAQTLKEAADKIGLVQKPSLKEEGVIQPLLFYNGKVLDGVSEVFAQMRAPKTNLHPATILENARRSYTFPQNLSPHFLVLRIFHLWNQPAPSSDAGPEAVPSSEQLKAKLLHRRLAGGDQPKEWDATVEVFLLRLLGEVYAEKIGKIKPVLAIKKARGATTQSRRARHETKSHARCWG